MIGEIGKQVLFHHHQRLNRGAFDCHRVATNFKDEKYNRNDAAYDLSGGGDLKSDLSAIQSFAPMPNAPEMRQQPPHRPRV